MGDFVLFPLYLWFYGSDLKRFSAYNMVWSTTRFIKNIIQNHKKKRSLVSVEFGIYRYNYYYRFYIKHTNTNFHKNLSFPRLRNLGNQHSTLADMLIFHTTLNVFKKSRTIMLNV